MTRTTLNPWIAVLAALPLSIAVAACGDDEESSDGSTSGIEISIPASGETTPGGKSEEKTKGKAAAPEVGKLPQPSKSEQQQIAKCVVEAQGDPEKIAACGEIVNE